MSAIEEPGTGLTMHNPWLRGTVKVVLGTVLTALALWASWQEVGHFMSWSVDRDDPIWLTLAEFLGIGVVTIVTCLAAWMAYEAVSERISPVFVHTGCRVRQLRTSTTTTPIITGVPPTQTVVMSTTTTHELVTSQGTWECGGNFCGAEVGATYTVRVRNGWVLSTQRTA